MSTNTSINRQSSPAHINIAAGRVSPRIYLYCTPNTRIRAIEATTLTMGTATVVNQGREPSKRDTINKKNNNAAISSTRLLISTARLNSSGTVTATHVKKIDKLCALEVDL